MAGFYCIYHGEEGLKKISERINLQTRLLAKILTDFGYELVETKDVFDTLVFKDSK
jgi:glycine dehydrogenase